MVIKDVGSGLSKPDEYWLARSIGHRVEDQPDYDYGKWVARLLPRGRHQRRAEPRGRRCRHQLAAAVAPQLPLPAADGAVQRRSGNSTMLLGASLIDPAINLRVKPG